MSAKISVGSGGGTLAEYNGTWDQWLMGRFVLEKPAPVRQTMGQNDEDSIIINIFFFLIYTSGTINYSTRVCI